MWSQTLRACTLTLLVLCTVIVQSDGTESGKILLDSLKTKDTTVPEPIFIINRDPGGDLNLNVQTGNTPTAGCFVETPKGETIEFRPKDTSDDRFTLRPPNIVTTCQVDVSKLTKSDQGMWKIYYTMDDVIEGTRYYSVAINGDHDSHETEDSDVPEDTVVPNPIVLIPVNSDPGGELHMNVRTGYAPMAECYVETPQGEVIQFRPVDNSDERFILRRETLVTYCAVDVTKLTKADEGVWRIYFTEFIIELIEGSTHYHLTINDVEEEEGDNITWLTTYRRISRIGLSHDISLSNRGHKEECSITPPNGVSKSLANLDLPGVEVHGSSHFVACRVTVGPMTQELIGEWIICSKYEEGGEVHKRCQHVNIEWLNANNPNAQLWLTERTKFNHVVNLNGTLRPVVRGINNYATCHMVTPDGEDLVITRDSGYPGLNLDPGIQACEVIMGPIDESLLGEWTLYGIFPGFSGDEIRYPISLRLYDEDNPYDQPYNVTLLYPRPEVVNIGNTIVIEITGSGATDSCEATSPSGQRYMLDGVKGTESVSFPDMGTRIVCSVSIGPITDNMVGNWQIIGKFSDRGIFTERRQQVQVIKEDPDNPIIDEDREVTNNAEQYFNTTMGSSHTITTRRYAFSDHESCHIRTPSGRQYTIMEGFNIPGVEVITGDNNIGCGVTIKVQSEDLIGDWVLISREISLFSPSETRQPFTIYVEERVDASPNRVTVTEGNDLYVRLQNPTNQNETCKLFEPEDIARQHFELDAAHGNTCGFIIKNVKMSYNGKWEIRYGKGITYRAFINVMVIGLWETEGKNLRWSQGRPVDVTIGPEDAIYCRTIDPLNRVVSEGFGRCHIVLDRAASEYNGIWKMIVGLPGKVLTEEYSFNIHVRTLADKPVVTTHVDKQQPVVTLSCSVPTEYEVKSCTFREPSGRMLMASQGVGEDRYSFHGAGTSISSEKHSHECGLRIANPETSDLGLWRCAVETDQEVYYGFLTVLCPWAMSDPAIAAQVVSEPTLTVQHEINKYLEGDSVTMSCSIQSPIRYCYFRARNGTIFNISPAVRSDRMEYVGAGLDAGECGIRFNSMAPTETGSWSCHVGLPDLSQAEQRVDFQLSVTKPVHVLQYVSSKQLIVRAEVQNELILEYCRYVRMDGTGFTSATLPDRYTAQENLSKGICSITIEDASILEHHPWTVVAKIVGKDAEVYGVTDHTIEMPEPETSSTTVIPTLPTISTNQPLPDLTTPRPSHNHNHNNTFRWTMVIIMGFLIISLGILLIPPVRRGTVARATLWRNSIRKSFIKKPLPDYHDVQTTTTSSSA